MSARSCSGGAAASSANYREEATMLRKFWALTIGLTLAASASLAFAQTPPSNKADCVKAKMKWDPKGGADKKGACVAAAPAKTDAKK